MTLSDIAPGAALTGSKPDRPTDASTPPVPNRPRQPDPATPKRASWRGRTVKMLDSLDFRSHG